MPQPPKDASADIADLLTDLGRAAATMATTIDAVAAFMRKNAQHMPALLELAEQWAEIKPHLGEPARPRLRVAANDAPELPLPPSTDGYDFYVVEASECDWSSSLGPKERGWLAQWSGPHDCHNEPVRENYAEAVIDAWRGAYEISSKTVEWRDEDGQSDADFLREIGSWIFDNVAPEDGLDQHHCDRLRAIAAKIVEAGS